jgi:hypothetical protein
MSGLGWIKFEPVKDFYHFPTTAAAKDGSVTVTLMIKLEGPLYPVHVQLSAAQAKAPGAEMVEAAKNG